MSKVDTKETLAIYAQDVPRALVMVAPILAETPEELCAFYELAARMQFLEALHKDMLMTERTDA